MKKGTRALMFALALVTVLFTGCGKKTPATLEDGTYFVEVSLSGGTGRASIESPAMLTVKDGVPMATIIWSSKYYDYMIVSDEKYLPQNAVGDNSTFEIPVSSFDDPMTVLADTTAMSEPHEIEYALVFDSSSIVAK